MVAEEVRWNGFKVGMGLGWYGFELKNSGCNSSWNSSWNSSCFQIGGFKWQSMPLALYGVGRCVWQSVGVSVYIS